MSRGRRRVALATLGALILAAGATVLLAWAGDGLPEPLAEVARLPGRLWARVVPPRVPPTARLEGLTDREQEAVAALAGAVDGLLVWSSNRSGNHELYLVDLGARRVRQLTDHPHVDFLSRISPDGRQVVFLRSQREWVSFREHDAWDVMLLALDGSGERRLATGGYHATWTADGRVVVFHRGPRVYRVDVATGRETLLFDGEREVPGLAQSGDFELAPAGDRIAFAFRGPFRGAAVFDLATRAFTPLTRVQACQTTWTPDGGSVLWMEAEGHGGTRVMTGRADGSGRRVLMDLPGPISHEYFPKLSPDGRWLVWGATARGHEHDRADYEIFAWEVGSPPERAIRVTHHPGNDQWPDLWVRPPR